jgi:hypothetical protein
MKRGGGGLTEMQWMSNAVGAAIIAGIGSFIGILITRQSKVSEFRQEWINSLRTEVASLISHAFTIYDWDGKKSDRFDVAFAEVHRLTALITLRLNPKEPESLALIAAMNDLRESIHTADAKFELINTKVNALTSTTQKVLKTEWRRVKRGEPLYRWCFRITVTIVIVFSIMAVLRYLQWA